MLEQNEYKILIIDDEVYSTGRNTRNYASTTELGSESRYDLYDKLFKMILVDHSCKFDLKFICIDDKDKFVKKFIKDNESKENTKFDFILIDENLDALSLFVDIKDEFKKTDHKIFDIYNIISDAYSSIKQHPPPVALITGFDVNEQNYNPIHKIASLLSRAYHAALVLNNKLEFKDLINEHFTIQELLTDETKRTLFFSNLKNYCDRFRALRETKKFKNNKTINLNRAIECAISKVVTYLEKANLINSVNFEKKSEFIESAKNAIASSKDTDSLKVFNALIGIRSSIKTEIDKKVKVKINNEFREKSMGTNEIIKVGNIKTGDLKEGATLIISIGHGNNIEA